MDHDLKSHPHDIGHDPVFLELRRKHYAGGSTASVVCPESGRMLTELCVLSESEAGFRFKCLTHPTSYFSPSVREADSLTDRQWREILASARKRSGWNVLRLMMLTDEQARRVSALCRRGGHLHVLADDQNLIVRGGQTFDQYLKSRGGSHNRNNRRCARQAEAAGFTITRELGLEEIFCVYERRSGKVGEGDYSVTEQFRGFISELRTAYVTEGRWREVGVRDPAGRLVAFAIGFTDRNGVHYLFQTAYDPELRSMRLGSIVFDRFIERALDEGCRYLSFCSSSDYIRHYATGAIRYRRVDVHSHTSVGWILFARVMGARLKRWLRGLRERSAPA